MISCSKILATIIAVVVFTGLSASSAFAGVGLGCYALDGSNTEIHVGLGGAVGFAAISAHAIHGETTYSGGGEKGTIPFGVAQGMILGEAYYIDFSDDDAQKIFISLRVNVDLLPKSNYLKLEEDDMPGTLTFEGEKPIPVSCSLG